MKPNSNAVVLFNRLNLLHKSSKPHPECPERLSTLIEALQQLSKQLGGRMEMRQVVDHGQFTDQAVEKLMIRVHGESYWQFVKEMWHEGIQKPEMFINMDTYFMKDTYRAALEAARTTLIAARTVYKQNVGSFAVVRPPGHHSGDKSQPHGFSFFNNVALAAEYLLASCQAKKVAIIDWDVHHGEGTQNLFYNRKDILYVSLHRYDEGKFFPHTHKSSSAHIGEGQGRSYNINVCWNLEQKPKGTTYAREETCGDEEYCHAFERIVKPVLRQYEADYILVSCGFDSAHGDPFGNLAITEAGYALMLAELMQINQKIMLVLEGGYNLSVLPWAGEVVVRQLIGQVPQQISDKVQAIKTAGQPNKIGKSGVSECVQCLGQFWQL